MHALFVLILSRFVLPPSFGRRVAAKTKIVWCL